jgi:hypothetical protein
MQAETSAGENQKGVVAYAAKYPDVTISGSSIVVVVRASVDLDCRRASARELK